MSVKPVYERQNFRQLDPGEWVQGHADYLLRYAIGKLNNEEHARDILQDTFLAGLEKTANFQFRCSERTWLTSILKNKIYRSYYHKARKKVIIESDLWEALEPDAVGSPLSRYYDNDPVVRKEFYRALDNCIQRLPNLWQQVFELKYLQDEPTPVICDRLGISPGNLWIICHRLRAEIKVSMKVFL